MNTAIKPCSCSSPFQDARYGKGMRVYTYGPKGGAKQGRVRTGQLRRHGEGYVCTVCGAFQSGGLA